MAAIKNGCPGATVTTKVSDSYPVAVSVSSSSGSVLWTGPQRRLFRKYAAEREKAMAEIAEAVRKHCAK